MTMRNLIGWVILALVLVLVGCNDEGRASAADSRPASYYLIAAPSGEQQVCRAQGEVLQNVLIKVMRPGDTLRFAVGSKDVADFAFKPGVEMAAAARRDKIAPEWAKVRRFYQAAVQNGGKGEPLGIAAVMPQVTDWAEARTDRQRVVVFIGAVQNPKAPSAPMARESAALKGTAVHVIDPGGNVAPEQLARGRSQLERFFAERGAMLVTFSTAKSAWERLNPSLLATLAPRKDATARDMTSARKEAAPQMAQPAAANPAGEASERCFRIRIRWEDRSTDYDLVVHQELAGKKRRFTSACSHRKNRLPRNWEEVSLEKLDKTEITEIRLFSGKPDSSLFVEVFDPDGRLIKSTDVHFLFADNHTRNKRVLMMDLLPKP